jgi:hypothetical protein
MYIRTAVSAFLAGCASRISNNLLAFRELL